MQKKRLKIILLSIFFLLLIPFIAMQFTKEVNWTFFDFDVAGGLLLVTSFACEFIFIKIKKAKYRIFFCAIILALLVIIWIELAVGIF